MPAPAPTPNDFTVRLPRLKSAYKLVRLASGDYSVHSLAHQETFHPVIGPVAEAEALYLKQLRLGDRLKEHKGEFVIWDVGLGAAQRHGEEGIETPRVAFVMVPLRVQQARWLGSVFSQLRTRCARPMALDRTSPRNSFAGNRLRPRNAHRSGERCKRRRLHCIHRAGNRSRRVSLCLGCAASRPSPSQNIHSVPALH